MSSAGLQYLFVGLFTVLSRTKQAGCGVQYQYMAKDCQTYMEIKGFFTVRFRRSRLRRKEGRRRNRQRVQILRRHQW